MGSHRKSGRGTSKNLSVPGSDSPGASPQMAACTPVCTLCQARPHCLNFRRKPRKACPHRTWVTMRGVANTWLSLTFASSTDGCLAWPGLASPQVPILGTPRIAWPLSLIKSCLQPSLSPWASGPTSPNLCVPACACGSPAPSSVGSGGQGGAGMCSERAAVCR